MEILFSFIGGAVITAVIALIVAKSVVKSRVAQAELSEKTKAEALYKSEQARMESDLRHSKERNEELMAQIQQDCQSARD